MNYQSTKLILPHYERGLSCFRYETKRNLRQTRISTSKFRRRISLYDGYTIRSSISVLAWPGQHFYNQYLRSTIDTHLSPPTAATPQKKLRNEILPTQGIFQEFFLKSFSKRF